MANFEATKNHRLCSKYFEAHCFYKSEQKTKLLHQAVPTIFLELPKHMQPSKIPKRVSSLHFAVLTFKIYVQIFCLNSVFKNAYNAVVHAAKLNFGPYFNFWNVIIVF